VIGHELKDPSSQSYEQNIFYENSFEKENDNIYAPTYENLVNGFSPSYNENFLEQDSMFKFDYVISY